MRRYETRQIPCFTCCCWPLLNAIFVLISWCLSVICLVISVFLLLSLLVTRILQLIRHGDDYKRLARFKHLIRLWLLANAVIVLIGLGTFYPFAKYVPHLKQVMILDLALTKWFVISIILCGLWLFTSFLYFVAHLVVANFMYDFSLNAGQACAEIIDSLICWWAAYEVMKYVPFVKHHQILGLPTRKWIKVSVLVVVGYNLITLFTHITVLLLWRLSKLLHHPINAGSTRLQDKIRRNIQLTHAVYYAKGLIVSINFMITSFLLLLTWILYFGRHLDMKSANVRSVWDYGKWTFVSLFICSVLWIIKAFVLLVWGSHSIHNTLGDRIIDTSRQLYFFGLLDSHEDDNEDEDEDENNCCNWLNALYSELVYLIRPSKRANKRETFMLTLKKLRKIHYVDIEQTIQCLFEAKKDLFLKGFSNNAMFCKDGPDDHDTRKTLMRKRKHLSTDDISWIDDLCRKLDHLVRENAISDAHREIKTWIERTHTECMNLANTLDSAKEVAECLNKIISWILIGVIFIMWLLLTGLATTKVLVIIASPLLAATFVFGDTCKTLFEGIIFVFVVHPFDVSDLCVIDNEEMEVRSIGIWTTTFTKLNRKQEVVIYPNKELTSKIIINNKTKKFDWSDRLEFNLEPAGHTDPKGDDNLIDDLRRKLSGANPPFESSSLNMSIVRNEDITKLVICLEYSATLTNDDNMTYFDSVWLKEKLRNEIRQIMQPFIQQCTREKEEISEGSQACLV